MTKIQYQFNVETKYKVSPSSDINKFEHWSKWTQLSVCIVSNVKLNSHFTKNRLHSISKNIVLTSKYILVYCCTKIYRPNVTLHWLLYKGGLNNYILFFQHCQQPDMHSWNPPKMPLRHPHFTCSTSWNFPLTFIFIVLSWCYAVKLHVGQASICFLIN